MSAPVNTPADPLRVLIVDDEPLARLRLRQLVETAEGLATGTRVVGEAADAAQAQAWLRAHPGACELMLLDVQMPGGDGTALAAALREAASQGGAAAPMVVFVTAHAEHALRAFELEALDYLTKPVRRERLLAALQRALQRRTAAAGAPAGPAEPVLIINDRGRVIRVPIGEVLYLKAELKYVTLRTAQHTHVLDDALSDLESRFGGRFLRVHRNALVARHAVRALERRLLASDGEEDAGEGWAVRLEGLPDEWLAVSRRQLPAVREALLELRS